MPGTEPPTRGEGKDGRWVLLGTVGVDSATLGISDPAFVEGYGGHMPSDARSAQWGLSGIKFWCGFGDGSYEVWGWVADYSSEEQSAGRVDERIAEIKMVLITDEDLSDWSVSG